MRKVNPLVGLPDSQRKSNQRSQSKDPKLDKSSNSVGYCIAIISCRKKLVDAHDNLRTGAKPLVDAITASLGFASDNNSRLAWEYGQLVSNDQGTIVKITKK